MKRALLMTLLVMLAATAAQARPQYSAMMGQSCFLCHTNPTGFGMRELYGSQFFAPTYLPMKPTHFEVLDKLRPDLSESVTIGADLRTIYLATNTQDDDYEGGLSAPLSTNTGTITQMEGYLYLNLRASEQFSIYYSHGVASSAGRFEAYGLMHFPKWKSWTKVGQFQENYGWRFADHTAFTRTGLWTGYSGTPFEGPLPPHYGVGAELGVRPYGTDFTVSFTNGQSTYPGDFDTRKKWYARYMLQRRIPKVGIVGTAGTSYYHSPKLTGNPEFGTFTAGPKENAWGGFGGISWDGLPGKRADAEGFGCLATTILFEYDRKAWKPYWASAPVTSAYSTTQVDVMVMQGLWLLAAYDWMNNSETNNLGGESERTTVGLRIFPIPSVEFTPKYRLYSSEGMPGVPPESRGQLRNKQQFELQGHFFF